MWPAIQTLALVVQNSRQACSYLSEGVSLTFDITISSSRREIPLPNHFLLSFFPAVEGRCYFPAAFQGEYVTQAIMSGVPTISYSSLSVLFDSIPVWGVCHRRIGNNVILMDDTGGITCFKCFNLILRSSNVLQIHTAGLDKCYTSEERAMADCPSEIAIREKRAREIMLYSEYKSFVYVFHIVAGCGGNFLPNVARAAAGKMMSLLTQLFDLVRQRVATSL